MASLKPGKPKPFDPSKGNLLPGRPKPGPGKPKPGPRKPKPGSLVDSTKEFTGKPLPDFQKMPSPIRKKKPVVPKRPGGR